MMSNHSYPTDKCTFELLSAYLDGEVTPQQRQEVQDLLANDAEIQGLYRRLLALRQEINNLPIPQPQQTSRQVAQGVFYKIDQEKKQKKRLMIGGGAIAIAALATLGGIFTNRNPLLQIAQQQGDSENLELSLGEPLLALGEPYSELYATEEPLALPVSQSLFYDIDQP